MCGADWYANDTSSNQGMEAMSYAALSRKSAPVAASATRAASKAASGNLHIGEVNDSFEQEADRVADQVMAGDGTRKGWSLSSMSIAAPLQRKCSCGGSSGPEECEECKKKERLQRKASDTTTTSVAPPIVHEVLNSPGRPLDKATRDFFESRFGYDLSGVSMHTDERAAKSAAAVHAKAYTVGSQIAFAANQYRPQTEEGRKLLAHELTHVIQQTGPSKPTSRIMPRIAGQQSKTLQRHFDPKELQKANPAGLHPLSIEELQGKMLKLMEKVDPTTRATLIRNKTVAIGLVEEVDAPGIPRYVYTVNQNWTNASLEKAVSDLNLTRWNPTPAVEGRGAVGAPGDAEQLLLEADPKQWRILGMAVSREVCGDCKLAIETSEHGKITVIEVKFPSPKTLGGFGAEGALEGPLGGGVGKINAPPEAGPAKSMEQTLEEAGFKGIGQKAAVAAENEAIAKEALLPTMRTGTVAELVLSETLGLAFALVTLIATAIWELVVAPKINLLLAELQAQRAKELKEEIQKEFQQWESQHINRVIKYCFLDQLKDYEKKGKTAHVNVQLRIALEDTSNRLQLFGDTPPESIFDVRLYGVGVTNISLSETPAKSSVTPLKRCDNCGAFGRGKSFMANNPLWEQTVSFSFVAPSAARVQKEVEADIGKGVKPTTADCITAAACFIATVCYGSPMADDVQMLRRFRDQYMMRTCVGRWLAYLYYQFSPRVAGWLWSRPVAREHVRRYVVGPIAAIVRSLFFAGQEFNRSGPE